MSVKSFLRNQRIAKALRIQIRKDFPENSKFRVATEGAEDYLVRQVLHFAEKDDATSTAAKQR